MSTIIEKAKKIQCLICDVDGVLTDGRLYLDNNGNEQKAFHVHDGVGIKMLLAVGIQVGVITAAISPIIEHRMKQLGVQHFYKGQTEKTKAYELLKSTLQLKDEAIAYVGDDLPDIPLIRQAGLGVAVANSLVQAKEFADYETTLTGGQGAVREICDLILKSQDKFDLALANHLAPPP